MRPEPTLLARIAAQPHDEEPRLACAEWFEKHGAGPRAEFIRAQLALRTRLNPVQRAEKEARVRELLSTHGKAWLAELPGVGKEGVHYSRGFVEELELSEKALTEHGEVLLASEPVFRLRVQVQDGKGLAKVAEQPWFERIRWLKLTGKADAGAKALAASPHVGHLESLLMPWTTAKGISALAQSEKLTGLRALSLTGSVDLGGDGLAALVQGRLKPERLFLTGIALEEGIASCVEGPLLESVTWLALNRDNLSDEDAEALAGSKSLRNLERLELAKNELSEEGALVFRSSKVLPRLKHLDLSGMWYSPKELEPLRRRFGRGLKL
jgi:uncharacterized protein (TIGR02996 family)